jgi:zinc transport system substrate-binding protein
VPAHRRILVVSLALTVAGISACSTTTTSTASSDPSRPTVVAAFYPLAYAAQQVGGDAIDVTSLTPAGVEPHDLELSAAQVAQIAEADLVLYVKGFQPAVDEAIEQQAADHAIDVSAGLTLLPGEDQGDEPSDGATDPHIWLDPANMAAIGESVGQRVSELAPSAADTVSADTEAFRAAMTNLSTEFSDALAECASRELVVSHEAFGYLARAFGLTQVGLSGLSPEAEPSPARLKEVSDLVRADGITTIYYETLVDPKVAQTVADETGATTAVLDPIEGLAPDSTGDYASIMRQNLATLVAGQSCT